MMIRFILPGVILIGFFLILAKIFEKLGFGTGLSRFLLRIPITFIMMGVVLIDWFLGMWALGLVGIIRTNQISIFHDWMLISAFVVGWMISYILSNSAIQGSGGAVSASQEDHKILVAKTQLAGAVMYITMLPAPLLFIGSIIYTFFDVMIK